MLGEWFVGDGAAVAERIGVCSLRFCDTIGPAWGGCGDLPNNLLGKSKHCLRMGNLYDCSQARGKFPQSSSTNLPRTCPTVNFPCYLFQMAGNTLILCRKIKNDSRCHYSPPVLPWGQIVATRFTEYFIIQRELGGYRVFPYCLIGFWCKPTVAAKSPPMPSFRSSAARQRRSFQRQYYQADHFAACGRGDDHAVCPPGNPDRSHGERIVPVRRIRGPIKSKALAVTGPCGCCRRDGRGESCARNFGDGNCLADRRRRGRLSWPHLSLISMCACAAKFQRGVGHGLSLLSVRLAGMANSAIFARSLCQSCRK